MPTQTSDMKRIAYLMVIFLALMLFGGCASSGQWTSFEDSAALTPTAVSQIVEDNHGNLWFAASGLYRYEIATDQWTLFSVPHFNASYAQAIAVGPQDDIWYGTRENGVGRIRPTMLIRHLHRNDHTSASSAQALGSTSATLRADGTVEGQLRSDPWGEERYSWGTTPTGYRYTGQRQDDTLGLYDYNARYYDPTVGRFISADMVVPEPTNPQSFNRYSYVVNRPLNLVDPSGQCYVSPDGEKICEPIIPQTTSGTTDIPSLQLIEVTPGIQIAIVPSSQIPEPVNEDISNILNILGAFLDLGETAFSLLDAIGFHHYGQFATILSIFDVVFSGIESTFGSGQTGYYQIHPSLPPMLVLGQDFLLTSAETVGIPILSAISQIVGSKLGGEKGLIIGETAGDALDVVSSFGSFLYDVSRILGIIPTGFAIGFYWNSDSGTRIPIPGIPVGQPVIVLIIYRD